MADNKISWKKHLIDIAPDVKAFIVDGEHVRANIEVDFALGGHHYYSKNIPENEIWLERTPSHRDLADILVHEYVERMYMKYSKVPYKTAHEYATSIENAIRHVGGESMNKSDLMKHIIDTKISVLDILEKCMEGDESKVKELLEIPGVKEPLLKPNMLEAAQSTSQDAQQDYDVMLERALKIKKNKKKKLKKSELVERWNLIKAKLDHTKSIMDLDAQLSNQDEDSEQSQEPDQQPQEDAQQDSQEQPQQDQPDQQPQEQEQPEDQQAEQDDNEELSPEAIMDNLRELGYSESEIAHIVHGHIAEPQDPIMSHKVEAMKAKTDMEQEHAKKMSDLKQREADLDHSHKQRVNDLDFEDLKQQKEITKHKIDHEKRMLDLEYSHAQKAKELELKAKDTGDQDVQNDLKRVEVEHKKALLALELEHERSLKALELKLKEHEMKLKLEQKKEQHSIKLDNIKNPQEKLIDPEVKE